MSPNNSPRFNLAQWLRGIFIDPGVRLVGYVVGFASVFVASQATLRALEQASNIALPNEIPDVSSTVEMYRRGYLSGGGAASVLLRHGYDADTASSLLALSKNLFSIPDLVNLRYKGFLTDAIYYARAGQLGVDEEQAKLYLSAYEQRLDILTVMSAWRRGFFKEGVEPDYFGDLEAQGWTKDRIELLKKATSFIPPPTDLIRFLMRDVFIPEFVKDYGMDQEYPAAADPYFEKIGIDHDTALLYWEAHWELPSISQGYEMYQRGQIKETDLRRLLRAQGVEPYWRDPLIAISYNPITRVDIRRLHAYGTVSDAELPALYQQIGYSPDNAKKLASFTITYNKAHPVGDAIKSLKVPAEFHGLSESMIVSAYQDRLIPHEVAVQYLGDINIPKEIAGFILSVADVKAHKQELKDEITIIEETYLQGGISLTEATTELGNLGLNDAQQAHALASLKRARRKQSALPTKAELKKLFMAKVISDRQYVDELRNLGYQDKYIVWYLIEDGVAQQDAEQAIINTDQFGTSPAYGNTSHA